MRCTGSVFARVPRRPARPGQAGTARAPGARPVAPPADALLRGDAASRASILLWLQATAGNRAAARAVASAAGNGAGASITLHGQTDAEYDGGTSAVVGQKVRRATGCECPADEPCLRAVGTLVIRYRANVTIRMPDLPDGLSACQQRRVRQFLRNVLRPHEDDHARRFHTYDRTTRRPFAVLGCGREALQADTQQRLQEMHDDEAAARADAADRLSAQIDPFVRPVDLDCD